MGWGLILNDVYLQRVTKDGIEWAIEDTERMIQFNRRSILTKVASTPRTYMDDGHPVHTESDFVREAFEELEELAELEYRYGLLLHARDCPDNVEGDC